MHYLLRRIRKLEGDVDESGYPPGSDAWYAFWLDIGCRAIRGEKIGLRIPYQVCDRARRNVERRRQALREQGERLVDGTSRGVRT